MKKLQISLCALLALGCISQSAQANLMQDQLSQLSVQAVALRDQATTYVQAYPKAFMGAAAGITAASLYFRSKAHQPERGIKLAYNYNGDILCKDIVDQKLQNGFHKDCLTELPEALETKDYRDLIKAGARILNQIKNNPHAIDKPETKHIVALAWHLYEPSMYKNQDFKRGTTTIRDNGNLYEFLLKYVDQKNSNAQKSSLRKVSFNPYAYPRVSTHFPKSQKAGNRQYGIDMRFDDSGTCQSVLPGGQNHLVFGKTDNGHTFIKFEQHGLYFWDGWLQHALGVIPTMGRKLPIIGKLLFGSNEYEGARKEHMPDDIKKAAKEAGLQRFKTISDIKQKCLSHPVRINENGSEYITLGLNPKYRDLYNLIAQKYPFLEDEGKRFGNEAIITERDLTLSRYYDENVSEEEKQHIRSIVDLYQRVLAGERS